MQVHGNFHQQVILPDLRKAPESGLYCFTLIPTPQGRMFFIIDALQNYPYCRLAGRRCIVRRSPMPSSQQLPTFPSFPLDTEKKHYPMKDIAFFA